MKIFLSRNVLRTCDLLGLHLPSKIWYQNVSWRPLEACELELGDSRQCVPFRTLGQLISGSEIRFEPLLSLSGWL